MHIPWPSPRDSIRDEIKAYGTLYVICHKKNKNKTSIKICNKIAELS